MITKSDKMTFGGVEYRIILVDDYSDLEGNPLYESNSLVFKTTKSDGSLKSKRALIKEIVDSMFKSILFSHCDDLGVDRDYFERWQYRLVFGLSKHIVVFYAMMVYYYKKLQLFFC